MTRNRHRCSPACNATRSYWVSTPDWTICATEQHGRVVAIAPILRRAWFGKPWREFSAWVRRRYPWQWQARQLPERPQQHGAGDQDQGTVSANARRSQVRDSATTT